MKINEILDPSDYRPGDEDNPRSPYYEEPPEDEFTTVDCSITLEDGTDLELSVEVGSRLVAGKYHGENKPAYYVDEWKIKKVLVDRHQVDTKKWLDGMKPEDIDCRDLIADELSDKLRYKQFNGKVYESEKDVDRLPAPTRVKRRRYSDED